MVKFKFESSSMTECDCAHTNDPACLSANHPTPGFSRETLWAGQSLAKTVSKNLNCPSAAAVNVRRQMMAAECDLHDLWKCHFGLPNTEQVTLNGGLGDLDAEKRFQIAPSSM